MNGFARATESPVARIGNHGPQPCTSMRQRAWNKSVFCCFSDLHSWFLIFALLTWMLGGSYYPAEFKNWSLLLYWFTGAVTAVMLFASVLLHELGRCMMALRYKVPVRNINAVPLRRGRSDRLVSRQRRLGTSACGDVSEPAGRPHSFPGHEQSLLRRSRGPDATTFGGRTHSQQRAALLPRQSRRHHRWLDDFASDQGSAAGPVDDDERRSGHAPAGTIETHKSRQGIVDRPPT
jgi:hypothetical protein